MREEASPVARLQRERDELAKAWLVELIETAPLSEAEEIDVAWVAREGPRLVASILRRLDQPDDGALAAASIDEALSARDLRSASAPGARVARDLAALHALLLGALAEEASEVESALAGLAVSLARAIGDAYAALAAELEAAPGAVSEHDTLTGLGGPAELADALRTQVAAQRRYGTPFAILLVDVDGLGRINDAYGRASGDRMLSALAAVVAKQIRLVDRAYRRGDDELCVLLPQQSPIQALTAAERLVALVRSAQANDGPRLDIAIGVAGCPEHGTDPDALLAKAEEATYEAKAAGDAAAIAGGATPAWLQDR